LPLAPVSASPRAAPLRRYTDLHAVVLCAEANRPVLLRRLEEHGVRCIEAEDVAAAQVALERRASQGERCDLLVIEDRPPGAGAESLAVSVRADPRFEATRTVLLASIRSAASLRRERSGAFDEIIVKPLRQRALSQCLGRLFADTPAEGKTPAIATPTATGSVLVVEDNAINREIARSILRRAGYTVAIAEDGLAALGAVEAETFDVVLMDLQMPVMDGLEATRRIRALSSPKARLPIVALTADAVEETRQRCGACGFDEFFAKPYRPEALVTLVANIVARVGGAEIVTDAVR
ncbi:MAG TPA: response regulator, partial [Stellaceae bacterium]|nr:response regulator [Stellaceae bacterium]